MHRIHNGKHFGKGLVALSALAVLGLAACGGGGNDPEASSGGSSESGSSSTSVTAKEYKFQPLGYHRRRFPLHAGTEERGCDRARF